jgi:hypothetical protein
MKTAPDGHDYIDYWHKKGAGRAGIRVWWDRCQTLASGPDGLMAVGEVITLPLRDELLDSQPPVGWTYLAGRPQITSEALYHMMRHPESDLFLVLQQHKPFEEARQAANPDY